MTTCNIKPAPEWIRKHKRFRPMHPPIFTDIGPGGVTLADIELARELFEILDDDSKDWYRRSASKYFGDID